MAAQGAENKCPALNKTFIPPSLRHRKHCKRERGNNVKEMEKGCGTASFEEDTGIAKSKS